MQETAALKAKYGDVESDDSDAESEDDDAKMLTPALDAQIFKAIDTIRHKRAGLYDSGVKVFAKSAADEAAEEGEEEDGEEEGGTDEEETVEKVEKVETAKKEEKEKPKGKRVTVTDQLLSHGLASDSDDDDEGDKRKARRGTLAYDAEQKA